MVLVARKKKGKPSSSDKVNVGVFIFIKACFHKIYIKYNFTARGIYMSTILMLNISMILAGKDIKGVLNEKV